MNHIYKLVRLQPTREEIKLEACRIVRNEWMKPEDRPNLLEMAALDEDNISLYPLVQKIGREILPPRMIDNQKMNSSFKFYVPKYKRKAGLNLGKLNISKLEENDFAPVGDFVPRDSFISSPAFSLIEDDDLDESSVVSELGFLMGSVVYKVPFEVPKDVHEKLQEIYREIAAMRERKRYRGGLVKEEVADYLDHALVIYKDLGEANKDN